MGGYVFGKFLGGRNRNAGYIVAPADPTGLPPVPGTESPREIWLGRSNRSRALAGTWTTRVQARRVSADPTADRKPKSLPVTELTGSNPAPCSSRRRSCPGGERGDRQSSVLRIQPLTGL